MITDHVFAFYGSLFVVTLALGFWLGCRFSVRQIKKLKAKLYFARLGI